jgi:hypothetical protein
MRSTKQKLNLTKQIVGHWPDFKSFLADEFYATETYEQSRTPEEWWQ